MAFAAPVPPPVSSPDDHDQRIILHDVSWEQYETILAIRGDRGRPRIAYLEGELELTSPSRGHERLKKLFARLLEAYADERGIEIEGIGSLTMRSAPRKRGAEPDECYEIGVSPKERPDLVIEVVWTSGGLDELELYRGLGVPEVWIWKAGVLQLFALRGERYEGIERSAALPDIDLTLLVSCLAEPRQSAAVRRLRAALRGR